MFELISITKDQCLGWVLSYPELAEKSFSMQNPRFEETKSQYMGIVFKDDLVAVVKYERFSEFSIQIHPYLKPTYWHSNFIHIINREIETFFRDAGELSLIVICPEDATHAIKTSKKVGYKECGCIRNAVNWKGKMNSLMMLQKDLQ